MLKHFQRHFPRYEPLSLAELYDDPFLFENFVHDHQTKLFSITAADQPETFASTLTHAREPRRGTWAARIPPGPRRSQSTTTRLALAKANLARVDLVGRERALSRVRGATCAARFGWWPDGVDTSARVNAADDASPADAVAPPPHRRRQRL